MIVRVSVWLLLLHLVSGLFEDQIGVFDWRQQYIGDIKFVITDYKAKYVLLGSAENVIAAINNKDGSIVWRQVMETGGNLLDLQLCDDYLISLSRKNATVIRSWNPVTGAIFWQKSLSENSLSSVAFRCLGQNSLITVHDAGVFIIRASDGTVRFSSTKISYKTLPDAFSIEQLSTGDSIRVAVLGYSESHLALSSSRTPSEMSVLPLRISVQEPQKSEIGQIETISMSRIKGIHHCVVIKPNNGTHLARNLVCLTSDNSANGSVLSSIPLENVASNEWKSTKISQTSAELVKLDDHRFIVTFNSGAGAVYRLSANGIPEELYRLTKAMLCAKATLNGKDYLFTAFQELNRPWENFALSIYDLDSGEPVPNLAPGLWTIATHHGAVEWIRPTVYVDSTGATAFRVLVRTEDHAIQHIRQNGHQRWLREEALAGIVAVELVDLPVSESQARMEDEFGHTNSNIFDMFAKRFRTQAAQLWAFLKYCASELPHFLRTASTSSPYADTSDRSVSTGADSSLGNGASNPVSTTHTLPARLRFSWTGTRENETEQWNEFDQFLTRDNFNLHKMIVVATRVGKLFGLESERGRLVWEHLVPSATVLANGNLALFQQRNTAHFPLPPIATVLLRSKLNNQPVLYSFNPITGVPLHKHPGHVHHLQWDIMQAILQPGPVSEASEYIRPILLLDVKSKLHVYPPEYAAAVAAPDGGPIYIYTIDHADARITGYKVGRRVTDHNETVYEAVRVWQMQLRSGQTEDSDEKVAHSIVTTAARPAAEHIHSVGRVLGDRSVLYKYLNPNLIAVLTAGGDLAAHTNSISIYLVDVVAGRILYSATHRRCSEPISLVHSENWIVYTYYNHKSLRHEVTVLELYEPFNQSGGPGELCASYLVPGPWQLFLRNIIPTSWISTPLTGASTESGRSADTLDPKSWNRGSRSYFSSLYRTTDAGGVCKSTGAHSLVPQVMQQSYIFSTAPTQGAAAASLTERGITSKSVIFGLQKGALIELPKSFLDPRRTLDMTQELMEEGVHPYAPVLPLSDQAVISYNQTVLGIRAIRTALTGLESTSLVFAYGLDLFFTRIAPSMTYDLLKEDFDYTAIATVTLGMIVASVVTNRLAARRAVMRAWS